MIKITALHGSYRTHRLYETLENIDKLPQLLKSWFYFEGTWILYYIKHEAPLPATLGSGKRKCSDS